MILLLMREGADFGVGIGESIHNQGIVCWHSIQISISHASKSPSPPHPT
jgi:hypothetical protein